MAVISITIIESPLQKYAGIPASLTLETNIPSTIFYTLDGTEPTVSSAVYTGSITMPNDDNTVILKAFATDGTFTSNTITEIYGTSTATQRQPRDKVELTGFCCDKAHFPFGSPTAAPGVNGIYDNTGGVTVDNPLEHEIPDGWDGTATDTPAGYTNEPSYSYDNVFSETNSIGQTGAGIGTLPANVTVLTGNPNSPPEWSSENSATFDPKALVIYQDSRQPQYDEDIPKLQRTHFDLENKETARYGTLLHTTEGASPQGSALRSQYNPTDNTITYYYYDNRVGRWIISKETFQPKNPNLGNYATIVTSRRIGQFVFKWIPFQYHKLIT